MVIKYALFSVTDKSGIVELARKLSETHKILASGGTGRALQQAGINVVEVATYTGSPEIFEGRVKTLHPKIHGGILSKRSEDHRQVMLDLDIGDIDVVVCNLYPFEQTVASGADQEAIIENIDIGGPTLIRAAAKNYQHVTVVVDPDDYALVANNYPLPENQRLELARKAFVLVAQYDIAIANYFSSVTPAQGENIFIHGERITELRYGENPHQAASVYQNQDRLFYEKVSGSKDPSYNNILDVLEGFHIVEDFEMPACAIIKHRTPCGVGADPELAKAYEKALATDKLSAYGGVYCFNKEVGNDTAVLLVKMFVDTVIAPGYTEDALTILKQKENMLILKSTGLRPLTRDFHEIPGGFVIQDHDMKNLTVGDYEIVSETKPTEFEIEELLFAWKVVKHARSNAIVVSRGTEALGIGSGQTSRVDAAKQAIKRAGDRAAGAVLASDAFFPFRDTVDTAAKAGIKAIIVPKGSIRDQDSIDAANEHGMIFVHTSFRAFKH